MKKKKEILLSFILCISLISNISVNAASFSNENIMITNGVEEENETEDENVNENTLEIDTETDTEIEYIADEEIIENDENVDCETKLIVESSVDLSQKTNANEVVCYDDTWILSFETSEEAEETLNELEEQSYINYVEQDSIVEIEGNVPNTNISENNINEGNILVAVIDTGVNGVNNEIDMTGEGNGDANGHGTAIANQIESSSNGISKIMSIKAIKENGQGTVSDVYKSIVYAIENNVNIINLSLSAIATEESKCLSSIIDKATEQGIKVVVSAGNKSNDVADYIPANVESAIVVSAVEPDGTFSSYSNYGDTIDYSAIGTTEFGTGTSISAAYVSGLLCLDDLPEGIDLGDTGWDAYYGNVTFGVNIDDTNNIDTDKNENTSDVSDLDDILKTDSVDGFIGWQNMTDEELDDVLSSNSDLIDAIFFQSLTEEEKEEILSRNTCLNGIHIYYDDISENSDGYELEGQHEEVFYEYLQNYDTSVITVQDGTVVSSTGYYYIVFNGDATSASSKYKIKITVSISSSSMQTTPTVSIDTSYSGYKNNQNLKINKVYKTQHGGTSKLTDSSEQETGEDEDGNKIYSTTTYPIFALRFSYTKPAYSYATTSKAFSYEGGRFNTSYCFSDDLGVLSSSASSGSTNKFYWNLNDITNDTEYKSSCNNKGVNKSSCTEYFYMQVNMNQTGITTCPDAGDTTVHNTLTIGLNYPTLTIKYGENGGTQGSNAAKDIDSTTTTISYDGSSVANLVNKSKFSLSRTGYHINSGEEWYISGGDTYDEDVDYLATEFKDFTNGTRFTSYTVTVKAKWVLNVATIQYNVNGGSVKTSNSTDTSGVYYNESGGVWYKTNSSGNIYVSSTSATSGFAIKNSSVKYSASSIDFINTGSFGLYKTGYHISSDEAWLVGSTSGNTITQNETTSSIDITKITSFIKSNDATVTLYANWQANTYTVAYNANGGSGSMTNSSHVYDTAKALTANSFTKTGYTFAGWNTKADGSGISYANKASVSNLTSTNEGTVILYAQWIASGYTVTFDSNGGSVSTTSKSVTYGSAYGSLPTPTRTNYAFDGWYTAKSGGTKVIASTVYQTIGNTTLYAHWSLEYCVTTFDSQGGICDTTEQTDTITAKYTNLPIPTRTGYEFKGWYTDENGVGEKIEIGSDIPDVENITLYANWELCPITITIPRNLILGTDGNCTFKITADNKIGVIKIGIDENIYLTQENKNQILKGNVSLNKTELTSDNHEVIGSIDVENITAGNWKANMNIDITFSLGE